jgi:hypothetical protein
VDENPRPAPGALTQLDGYVEKLRVQLPAAPPDVLDGYVKYAPWVAVVFGAFACIALLAALGLGAILGPLLFFAGTYGVAYYGAAALLGILFSLLIAAGYLAGGYLMLQRSLNGWWLVAGGLVISVLQSLLTSSLISLLVALIIGYIHVQVRPRYT